MKELERLGRPGLAYVKVKELSQKTRGGKKEDSV